ncbi:MAG: hypothetical protein JOZ83_09945 [Silvibacterium sp.]|nr:hypothetical protein [Silvibacterium sp.]
MDAFRPGIILLTALPLLAGARPAAAQAASPAPPIQAQPATRGDSNRPLMPGEDDPMLRQFSQSQVMKRNDMRQKLIVADTARLVTLAQQLKDEADKGTINKTSPAFARKVEEIEKLAKTVKDKMREGQ